MSIHLIFANGSNPYVKFNMTEKEFEEEINAWCKNHILKLDYIEDDIYNYKVFDKNKKFPF